MESFRAYRDLARKRGPDPYWTPVVPLHRAISFPLSWLYAAARVDPLAISFVGLGLALAGAALLVAFQQGPGFWAGLVLLKLGVVHDYCDGEVARYRIAKGLQSPATRRIGIFADIWVYTILVQALMPILLGAFAWRMGHSPWWPVAGAGVAFLLLSSYVVAFGKAAYWPERAPDLTRQSPSLATDAGGVVQAARKAYFQLFETAVFTTHAAIVLAAWSLVGGTPPWALAYVAACLAALGLAFLVGHVQALASFDRETKHP